MGDLKVKYCPTLKCFPNHFRKPLQGDSFQKFIADIQRIPEDTQINNWNGTDPRRLSSSDHRSVLKGVTEQQTQ